MPDPGADAAEGGARFAATRRGDRPRQRDGTSAVEMQIFAATEGLLEEVGLLDFGVSEICRRAEVARGTFYFYFSSKYAVLEGLLARVMDQIYEVMAPFASGREGVSPAQTLASSLEAGWALWSEHRMLLRAVCEHWASVPELRDLWLGVMERFTDAIAGEIDREREAGIASPGVDSRQLAAILLWSAERSAYVAGLGVQADLPNEDAIFKSMLTLWLRAIYAETPDP